MMDIQNKISDERLSFYATTQPPFGYTGSDINRMARELVSLRAQLAELQESRDQWRANAHEFSRCADRLEAKLTELAKQEPYLIPNLEHFISFWRKIESSDMKPGKNEISHTLWLLEELAKTELFTRSAPPAPVVDPGLLAQFNRHRLLQIIVTGPDASGAEQNTLARIALAFYPKETSGSVADE